MSYLEGGTSCVSHRGGTSCVSPRGRGQSQGQGPFVPVLGTVGAVVLVLGTGPICVSARGRAHLCQC